MKTYQTVLLFSFLGTLSPTAANPLPESYEDPNLPFLHEDDLGFWGDHMGISVDGQSNTEEQLISPISAESEQPLDLFSSSQILETTGFSEWNNLIDSLEQPADLFAASDSYGTVGDVPWNTMDTPESLEHPADLFAASDPDGTVANVDWNPMGTSIALAAEVPHCGTTQTPVCCANPADQTGCIFCKLPLVDVTDISSQVPSHLLRDYV